MSRLTERIRRCAVVALLAVALPTVGSAIATGDPDHRFNDRGYRIEDYRAPVPANAEGATVISAESLRAWLRAARRPVLVDVYAALRRPASDPLEAVWLVPKPRESLPGAIWLPNVGYGELDASVDQYFRSNLKRLTGGDLAYPVVLFCVSDCWMSWNAIKRARAYGYSRLYWYRDGTDGWQVHGYQLQPVDAEPLVGASNP